MSGLESHSEHEVNGSGLMKLHTQVDCAHYLQQDSIIIIIIIIIIIVKFVIFV